jgi:glycosyltransferase involved in cell wall biosynthesis
MRILFCSQAAHTGGGVEVWLESLSAALDARGWDVVTGLAKGRFHDPVRYAARHRVLQPIPIDGSSGLREDRILALRRLFESVKPDVIFPVNLADALTATAYWKASGAHVRLATCIHGQGDDRIEQVRAHASFVDLAASVSRRATGHLELVMGGNERIRHIPTGVAPALEPPRSREQLRSIAYIGRLDFDKRVRDAIPLIRALGDMEIIFHVAGSGPDESYLREALENDPRVIFHGDVSREKLYSDLYPNIDAILIFSEAEAGPIVAWEAMIHGVVPITSDYAGREEENVIRHGETGLVFPVGDVDRAATAIRSVISAGSLRELSDRARSDLPEAYTLAAFEEGWDAALRATAELPVRRGERTDLPPLLSPGLLSRLGLGPRATSGLRYFFGRRFNHKDPGSEWPH